ncbi:MAG TPA: anaerobic ribonucleoside-triphosphate reductase activating protein [Lachnospiraceae bacterium]|nr:anaerobic ribonucleoside-triphosphate reductase activating protein [Lachnospiraceae bacterium]
MIIGGYASTTLLDYPGQLACTIFTRGCNYRCPFCQNGSLVLPDKNAESYSESEILEKLERRVGILEGVCITGGEPTLQKDLIPFIRKIKQMGFLVKLDSNGSNPLLLQELIEASLVDCIAMDIKSAPDSYAAVCGLHSIDLMAVRSSVQLLLNCNIEYEFRTTLVKGLHTSADILGIRDWLAGAKAYYLQSYEESDRILTALQGRKLPFSAFSKEELRSFLTIVQEKIPHATVRGVDLY